MLNSQETNSYLKEIKQSIKDKNNLNEEHLASLKNFFSHKFNEVESIFKQIDLKGMEEFIDNSEFLCLNDQESVFAKDEDCTKYYFLLFGDIVLYSEEKTKLTSKILKTISGGVVFGHKVKDKFQYYAYAKNQIQLISIDKILFNNLLDNLKNRLINIKNIFLKKFVPNIRSLADETFQKLKERFVKLECNKGAKIIVDGEYDEFITFIVEGECVAIKNIKKIKNLKEVLTKNKKDNITHVVIEKYSKTNYNIYIRQRRCYWSLYFS